METTIDPDVHWRFNINVVVKLYVQVEHAFRLIIQMKVPVPVQWLFIKVAKWPHAR